MKARPDKLGHSPQLQRKLMILQNFVVDLSGTPYTKYSFELFFANKSQCGFQWLWLLLQHFLVAAAAIGRPDVFLIQDASADSSSQILRLFETLPHWQRHDPIPSASGIFWKNFGQISSYSTSRSDKLAIVGEFPIFTGAENYQSILTNHCIDCFASQLLLEQPWSLRNNIIRASKVISGLALKISQKGHHSYCDTIGHIRTKISFILYAVPYFACWGAARCDVKILNHQFPL